MLFKAVDGNPWHLAVGPSVRPSVVLAQPEPEEEEEAVMASAVFMVRRFISRSSHLGFSWPQEQQATNTVTAAPKVLG